MSSARIDLSSRGSVCSMGGIDRTKPAILDPYLSNVEWDKFCNDVDQVLKPVHFWNKVALGFFGVTFLTFLICIIVQFATMSSNNPFEEDDDDGIPGATLFIIPVVSMIIGGVGMCLFSYKASKASLELERVCRETSQHQPRLSFHVRYERHFFSSYGGTSVGVGVHDHHHHHHHSHSTTTQYIEVSINPNTVQVVTLQQQPMATTLGVGDPELAYNANNAGTTTAERFENLEKAKPFMTEKEYQEKRAEILASM